MLVAAKCYPKTQFDFLAHDNFCNLFFKVSINFNFSFNKYKQMYKQK